MNGPAHDERTPLLPTQDDGGRRRSRLSLDVEAASIIQSYVSVEEQKLSGAAIGERLEYNGYTTIDWLHDLVKDSYRIRFVHAGKGIRGKIFALCDSSSGWVAVAIAGALTACVAYFIDIGVVTVSDWKEGYCTRNPLLNREVCCKDPNSLAGGGESPGNPLGEACAGFKEWSNNYAASYAIYVAFAVVFGIISCSITMTTKRPLPAAASGHGDAVPQDRQTPTAPKKGKSLYMAAGSGIPEIKTILSGFVIPHFLDFRVLVVKAIGAIFAVATGMCLGKEGPLVHISTSVGWLVAQQFPRFRDNGRKMRELLSAACAAGISVAFGAPIGGVLFSYEEISTHFPRKVLWRAFLCSMVAAITLKALNPTGTGKLVLFETNYGTSYSPVHYLVFILLGVVGGLFGACFCRLNFMWSKWFRGFRLIQNYPVLEAALVVLATALLQYPNPLTRETGDVIVKALLVDCRGDGEQPSWICEHEAGSRVSLRYVGVLVHGTVVKLVLTIITFGIKVPSGIIIPALDAGAFFGRLVGQILKCYEGATASSSSASTAPGIFALVGAAAFLGGVSRMTISLCVIMFELTGELEYVLPHMVAVLVAKWVADALGRENVYDLAQAVLGHPFLDLDHGMALVQRRARSDDDREGATVADLLPSAREMEEIVVVVPASGVVPRGLLEGKLAQLRERGYMDGGLVLVQGGNALRGYLAEGELEFGLEQLGPLYDSDADVRLLGQAEEGDFDLSNFVDRTPMTLSAAAPMEYAIEMFGKLGLRHLVVLEEDTAKVKGVIIKKRMVVYVDRLKHH